MLWIESGSIRKIIVKDCVITRLCHNKTVSAKIESLGYPSSDSKNALPIRVILEAIATGVMSSAWSIRQNGHPSMHRVAALSYLIGKDCVV